MSTSLSFSFSLFIHSLLGSTPFIYFFIKLQRSLRLISCGYCWNGDHAGSFPETGRGRQRSWRSRTGGWLGWKRKRSSTQVVEVFGWRLMIFRKWLCLKNAVAAHSVAEYSLINRYYCRKENITGWLGFSVISMSCCQIACSKPSVESFFFFPSFKKNEKVNHRHHLVRER